MTITNSMYRLRTMPTSLQLDVNSHDKHDIAHSPLLRDIIVPSEGM